MDRRKLILTGAAAGLTAFALEAAPRITPCVCGSPRCR